LLGVTSDNASNMNTFFDYFKKMCNENNVTFDIEHQRVRCFAHIINLAAQDALKSLKGTGPDSEEEVLNNKVPVGVIAKLRILVTKIRASPQRRERFSMQCTVLKIKDLELIPDIRTRWNSTYMIMNRALYLPDNELKIYLLSDEDWNRIQEVESLMECFQTATLAMKDVVIAANNAKEKLLRYYPTSDGLVYIISTILDPKNKMEYYHENGFDDYIEIYKKQITEL
ncbi:7840_t:CDS:2, partial [Rhizophagus irregularis]